MSGIDFIMVMLGFISICSFLSEIIKLLQEIKEKL